MNPILLLNRWVVVDETIFDEQPVSSAILDVGDLVLVAILFLDGVSISVVDVVVFIVVPFLLLNIDDPFHLVDGVIAFEVVEVENFDGLGG